MLYLSLSLYFFNIFYVRCVCTRLVEIICEICRICINKCNALHQHTPVYTRAIHMNNKAHKPFSSNRWFGTREREREIERGALHLMTFACDCDLVAQAIECHWMHPFAVVVACRKKVIVSDCLRFLLLAYCRRGLTIQRTTFAMYAYIIIMLRLVYIYSKKWTLVLSGSFVRMHVTYNFVVVDANKWIVVAFWYLYRLPQRPSSCKERAAHFERLNINWKREETIPARTEIRNNNNNNWQKNLCDILVSHAIATSRCIETIFRITSYYIIRSDVIRSYGIGAHPVPFFVHSLVYQKIWKSIVSNNSNALCARMAVESWPAVASFELKKIYHIIHYRISVPEREKYSLSFVGTWAHDAYMC